MKILDRFCYICTVILLMLMGLALIGAATQRAQEKEGPRVGTYTSNSSGEYKTTYYVIP